MSYSTDLSPTDSSSHVLDGHDGCMLGAGWGRGVPGVGMAGYWEGGIPGTQPQSQIEAYFRIFKIYRFIRPFD